MALIHSPFIRAFAISLATCVLIGLAACSQPPRHEAAELIITNGRVYTFSWDDPAVDGSPAANAPHSANGWQPDAEALAVKDGTILFVGSAEEAESYRGSETRVMDVGGATVLPGLIDSHTHVLALGRIRSQVNLIDVATAEEAVERVAAATALANSDIPWNGPLGCVRVCRVDGEFVLNPSLDQIKESDMDLTLAGAGGKVMEIELEADEVSEEDLIAAIKAGYSVAVEARPGQPPLESGPGEGSQALGLNEAVEALMVRSKPLVVRAVPRLVNVEERHNESRPLVVSPNAARGLDILGVRLRLT